MDQRRHPRGAESASRYLCEKPEEEAGRGHYRRIGLGGLVAALTVAVATPAAAQAERLLSGGPPLRGEAAGVSMVVGLILFSTVTALLHLMGRRRWTERERQLNADLTEARTRLDRAEVYLLAEPQNIITWRSASAEPEIEGHLPLGTDVVVPRRVLAFGFWLPPVAAQQLERAVEALRHEGASFRMALVAKDGRHFEAEGRPMGGRAVLRIRDVSGDRLDLTRLERRFAQLSREHDLLRDLVDAMPEPAWSRDPEGRLTWVNAAYARAVEHRSCHEAVTAAAELLDRQAREEAIKAREAGAVWRATVPAVVAGERHNLDVLEIAGAAGSAGVARDRQEVDLLRDDLRKQMEAQAGTLDQLSTAVAIFDGQKRLSFHNAAYRVLWELDPAFLEGRPTDGEILDRLRSEGRLPEQADYRAWKMGVMAAYQAVETGETLWYLPDGRALRVVTSPNPKGGVIYLFDNVTERYYLESRFNALIRVQGETLDTLKEAVAVFGTDGRLKLFNPAFGAMWALGPETLAEQPHIDAIAGRCGSLTPNDDVWSRIRSSVAGLHDLREGFFQRVFRSDGSVIETTAAPLPDGATLLTFGDVTTSVNYEQALKSQNEALEAAEKLRNDFVHHVSYELRSPLTNIIGFIQLLSDGKIGPLNPKQVEYAGYISKSSAALLAIINDILDLATIDMDVMELNLAAVDIAQTMAEAAEGVQDRLAELSINLQIVAIDGIGSFHADGKRLRQVLFNLLSNAIGFSAPGQTVTLAALRRDEEIVFKVSDQGRGIPMDMLPRVFDRFHTDTIGSRHRGVGLGLSLVRSLVELHGGKVLIDSAPNEGTTVTCIFPLLRAGSVTVKALH